MKRLRALALVATAYAASPASTSTSRLAPELWFDLKGSASTSAMDALVDLFEGVRDRNLELPPGPVRSRIPARAFHTMIAVDAVLSYNSTDSSAAVASLPRFAIDGTAVRRGGKHVGTVITARSGAEKETRVAIESAIRGGAYGVVVLEDADADLLEFAVERARHCRDISGVDVKICATSSTPDVALSVPGLDIIAIPGDAVDSWCKALQTKHDLPPRPVGEA